MQLGYLKFYKNIKPKTMKNKNIVSLNEDFLDDLELVEGKNASLVEMIQNLGTLEDVIDTIWVTPVSMLKTIKAIAKIENK